jgi:hypothetical protein
MNPISPASFTKSALNVSGNIAKVAFNITHKGYSDALSQLAIGTVALYVFLTAVGSNAGVFSNGLFKSIRDYSRDMVTFIIIAWAYLNRNYGTVRFLGLFALGSTLNLALSNLPLAASVPNWVQNVKTAGATVGLSLAQAGAVATAFSLHA